MKKKTQKTPIIFNSSSALYRMTTPFFKHPKTRYPARKRKQKWNPEEAKFKNSLFLCTEHPFLRSKPPPPPRLKNPEKPAADISTVS
jgi:hypothetical protein